MAKHNPTSWPREVTLKKRPKHGEENPLRLLQILLKEWNEGEVKGRSEKEGGNRRSRIHRRPWHCEGSRTQRTIPARRHAANSPRDARPLLMFVHISMNRVSGMIDYAFFVCVLDAFKPRSAVGKNTNSNTKGPS